jgi:DNA-binding response OmpR family regulator
MARILVADDNRQFVEMLCATLEDAGHEVVSAYSGLGVMDLIEREEIDLLILDCADARPLRRRGGRAASARSSKIPVLLMTGDSGGQFAPSGWPLLDKPFSEQQLLDAVDALLLGLELVDLHEALLRLGVDVRDHLDVRLEPEPRSFAFSRPSTW